MSKTKIIFTIKYSKIMCKCYSMETVIKSNVKYNFGLKNYENSIIIQFHNFKQHRGP